MWLQRLQPASLFLSSLALLVASSPLPVGSKSTPVELRQLTAANFKENIDHNDWLVEFFSPWCGHCKHFKPTWEELVQSRDDPPRLNLAQVDCVADGDLCSSQDVTYYPFIRLYRNLPNGTQTKEIFDDSRTLSNLESWLDKRSPKLTSLPPVADAAEKEAEKKEPAKKYNLDGKVISLGPNDFRNKVASEPTIVKFYAPWCGHCQKLAPKWIQLAAELKGVINVAEVNCEAHGSICSNEGIEGYPSIALYLNGKKADYTGSKTVPALTSFVQRAVAPAIIKVDADEFNQNLEEKDTVFLLLHGGTDAKLLELVRTASSSLMGDPTIYSSSSAELLSQYSLGTPSTPVLLAIKSHSQSSYVSRLNIDGTVSADRLENWLQRNRFPVVSPLAMDNFHSVMKNPTKPFVVLAAIDPGEEGSTAHSTTDEDEEGGAPSAANLSSMKMSSNAKKQIAMLERISKSWAKDGVAKDKARNTVFVWMDGRKWGKWLKSMYGIKDVSEVKNPNGGVGGGVALVVVDHSALIYYDTDEQGQPISLTEKSVSSALRAVYAGKGMPKHSENWLERMARSANNRLLAIEAYVKTHIITTVFGVVAFTILFFWVLTRCLDDSRQPGDYYAPVDEKRHNRRLD